MQKTIVCERRDCCLEKDFYDNRRMKRVLVDDLEETSHECDGYIF